MLKSQYSGKTHVEMYVEGKLSSKACFFKKNEEYVLIRAVPSAIIVIGFYIIIIHEWKFNTDRIEISYTACVTLCIHWDFHLHKKRRTQEVWLRLIVMENFDPDLKMYVPFEKNSNWWKIWSVYKTSKNIFRCNFEKDMIDWGIGNKHTPERDRRSRSVYVFYCLGTGQIF